uniref:Putative secreted protein n=1 Tax=Amblyomma americanum TaxID=6943 RepID=A0A0C9S4B5_AMBAM
MGVQKMNAQAMLAVFLSLTLVLESTAGEHLGNPEPSSTLRLTCVVEDQPDYNVNPICCAPHADCKKEPRPPHPPRWFFNLALGACGIYRLESGCNTTSNDFNTCWECEKECLGFSAELAKERCGDYI